MRINNNMSAVITNKQLLRTENNLTKSMERLSSGLKINHAKDNPAGMAISNKMQAQIDALDRASSNASDGTSVLQIADGALNETSAILQRMRELSVQAANGTNSLEDKQAIQDEIEALKDEVNRISKDTEYNSKSLLDGSLDTRVYTDNANVSRVNVSDYVNPGKSISKQPQQRQQILQQMWELILRVRGQSVHLEQFPSMVLPWILMQMTQWQKFMRKSVQQQRLARQR